MRVLVGLFDDGANSNTAICIERESAQLLSEIKPQPTIKAILWVVRACVTDCAGDWEIAQNKVEQKAVFDSKISRCFCVRLCFQLIWCQ